MPHKPANDQGRALSAALAKDQAHTLLDELSSLGTEEGRASMARAGIVAEKSYGISVPVLRDLAKRVGRNHDLALALWDTGYHEARILATLVDEPDKVTSKQMDEWAQDFDNSALCDAACMNLFDRVEHAWDKVDEWSDHKEEFVKRGAFALIASIAQHDKRASIDDKFIAALELIERESTDERTFVKKSVNLALRALGKRNATLRDRAIEVSERLAASTNKTAKWIGKDAVKKLETGGESA